MKRPKPAPDRAPPDPAKPAYDNPVRNKGDLAAGNNAPSQPPEPRDDTPQGHPSDKVLGRKPAR